MKGKVHNAGGIALAISAAALYALSAPICKLLLADIPPTLMAGLLYVGAGIGMMILAAVRKLIGGSDIGGGRLTRAELPYTLAMIALDIAAPILLMIGLQRTSAASTSLLNNFEIVATAIIALALFKEKISRRLLLGIISITLSCLILSIEDIGSLNFSYGSLFVLAAALCWGFENNCTRKISSKDPMQIGLLKGMFSGLGSLVIGLINGERTGSVISILAVLLLGFLSYGMSIYLYVFAQRSLGAARTSAYYAIAPFIGVLLSLLIFGAIPGYSFIIALAVMAVGAWLCSSDEPLIKNAASISRRKK